MFFVDSPNTSRGLYDRGLIPLSKLLGYLTTEGSRVPTYDVDANQKSGYDQESIWYNIPIFTRYFIHTEEVRDL